MGWMRLNPSFAPNLPGVSYLGDDAGCTSWFPILRSQFQSTERERGDNKSDSMLHDCGRDGGLFVQSRNRKDGQIKVRQSKVR